MDAVSPLSALAAYNKMRSQVNGAAAVNSQAGEEFERIRHFLEAYLAEHDTPAGKG